MEAYFNVHFFKERTRKIDMQHLLSYFEVLEGTTVKLDSAEMIIDYKMPRLGYMARFLITKKSKVPNISRLSPKYLDLNFHLELPLLTPDFPTKKLFEIVKDIANTFELCIYSEMFDDVLPFKMELLMKAFTLAKEAFINKNPSLMREYNVLDKQILSNILRYNDEMLSLQLYYKDENTYVPNYLVLKDEYGQMHLAFEWKILAATVFPPNSEYIFYNNETNIKIVSIKETIVALDKLLLDVPGFISNTKVTGPKLKKIHKIMKKNKFSKIENRFHQVAITTLID